MDFHQLLNILLLSLSLTTILLTMISYILYKFRQIPEMIGKAKTGKKMEGAFFRRYEPESMHHTTIYVKPKRSYLPRTVAVFFFVILSVIFGALFSQTYFSNHAFNGGRAKGYLELQKMGLLKTHDFMPVDTKQVLSENVAESFTQDDNRLLSLLQTRKIALIQTPSKSESALPAWSALLSRLKIPFHSQSDFLGIEPGEVVVIPDAESVSPELRSSISSLLSTGIPVLVTGAVATVKASVNAKWLEDCFGIKWSEQINGDPQPVIFAPKSVPFLQVPAGLLLEWTPLNNKYQATSTAGFSPLMVSNYRGTPSPEKYVRANFRFTAETIKRTRTGWIQLDPTPIKDAAVAEEAYQNSTFVHSLAWLAGIPQARVEDWKDGKEVAVVMSVDSEDKFENVEQFLNVFRSTKTPATFFVVSELYAKSSEIMKDLEADFEIASHSENHGLFENQSQSQQFDRIQTSRLEIEELSRRPVIGFRPPEEKYGPETVAATVGNHLEYFLGDSRFFRFAPTEIAGGKLLYYSRVVLDDFNIIRRHDLANTQDIVNVLYDDFSRAKTLGGAYLFSMHTQVFGLTLYKDALTELLNQIDGTKSAWKTNYRELTHWYWDRQKIEVRVEIEQGHSFLSVKSNATEEVDGLLVRLDDGTNKTYDAVRIEKISPGETQRIDLAPMSQ